MDDNLNDLETGITSNIPRNLNKKMRKRKELDALLKCRLPKNHSNDVLRNSEDELFLPHQNPSITKFRSSRYRRCSNYFQHILSFVLVSIFMITCVGLIYVNIELKNEVENLSSRINEIEKNFSNIKLNNLLSTIEQIKIRLNFIEHWNFSYIYDQLQKLQIQVLSKLQNIEHKSKQFSKTTNELDNEIQNTKIQELITHLEQLNNLVHNSSDKTSVILTEFQSDLDKLRNKIDECKCSKVIISASTKLTTLAFEKLNNENKQTENATDVEQIVNQPSVIN